MRLSHKTDEYSLFGTSLLFLPLLNSKHSSPIVYDCYIDSGKDATVSRAQSFNKQRTVGLSVRRMTIIHPLVSMDPYPSIKLNLAQLPGGGIICLW